MKTQTSRRVFLGQAGLAIGAATLAPGKSNAASPSTKPEVVNASPPKPVAAKWQITLQPTGWNIYATRFVDPPTWTWQPLDGAAAYIVQIAGDADTKARTIRLDQPSFDMSKDWPAMADGPIDMLAWAADSQDRPISNTLHRRFWKVPGFDGVRQQPLDWNASVERVIAYLLAPARDEVQDYERGLPRSCWTCCENNVSGQRHFIAFPALHHPSFICAYLEYASEFPDSKLAPEALRQAKQYSDWLLENRLPADWRCGLFPFSSIQEGRTEGHVEGRNITLFRAARVGEAMVEMFRQSRQDKYLGYARHLADKFVELQRTDGSWPYRVDPKDGKVVEEYTSNAVTPARLMGILEAIEPNDKYAVAREKAAKWVLENPVRTRRWQGMYEDVKANAPFKDLEHWDTNEMIRYLVHYHRAAPEMARIAEDLNRFIEDQFVVWQPSDRSIAERCPTPTVLEQYTCYKPMEVHTAMWLQSLLALHRASGKEEYLSKAIAAGNSIVRAQQSSGAYSTWGSDTRFGRPLNTIDWPGCNAVAALGVMLLARYCKSPDKARDEVQPL